jgi:hypothetical protein
MICCVTSAEQMREHILRIRCIWVELDGVLLYNMDKAQCLARSRHEWRFKINILAKYILFRRKMRSTLSFAILVSVYRRNLDKQTAIAERQ